MWLTARILILCFAVDSVLIGCSIQQSSSFFVEQAAISEIGIHRKIRESLKQRISPLFGELFAVTGHRISTGKGTVLATRSFLSTVPPLPDIAGWEKITIYLPYSLSEKITYISVENEDIIVFWSKGASNFPRTGRFGYGTSGWIRFGESSKHRLVIDFEISIQSFEPFFSTSPHSQFVIRQDLTLQETQVDDLTPWEGAVGSHIYDESIH